MSTETIILIGVSIYLVAMLVIGIVVARRAGTEEDFIVAGRKLPIWILAATIIATWFGGGTMLGASGTGYDGGFLASMADPFGASLVMFLVGFFFVRTFRRMKLLTIVEFFESRFGPVAGMVATVGLLMSNIGWTGAMMVAFGHVFSTLTGYPMELGILGGAVIVLAYTVLGGMWAVAVTDFIQITIIGIGLVMLLTVVLIDVGGWGAIAAQMPEHTFRMIPLEHTAEKWLRYLRLWFISGSPTCPPKRLCSAFSPPRPSGSHRMPFTWPGLVTWCLAPSLSCWGLSPLSRYQDWKTPRLQSRDWPSSIFTPSPSPFLLAPCWPPS